MHDSPWTTTVSGGSLAPVSTPIAPQSGVDQINSASYLTNSDKITLMQQWASELATQTSLDTLATTWSVSRTAYDAAVTALSTGLITAGAPSNWAAIWPDGTTSGPWTNVQTSLKNLWANIATARTALQAAIASAQSTSQANAALTAAILAAQPHNVAWAYASKPTLPSSSYPAGYYAITSDSRTVQVSTDGTTWNDIFIATAGLFGTITAGQLAANAIQTSNYAETGGAPTAGAKMDISSVALKVAPGNLQIGPTVLSSYLLPRIVQALDGNATNGFVFYRGNVDVTQAGGAPAIGCLYIRAMCAGWNGTYFTQDYTWELRPSATALVNNIIPPGIDNLDAMRYLSVTFYSSTGTLLYTTQVALTDRLYVVSGSQTANSSFGQFQFVYKANYGQSGGAAQFNGYMRTQLFNAYGPSAQKDFGPSSNSIGAILTAGTIPGAGTVSSGGGGGTGGGGCPAPWVPVTLASGLVVHAGDLYDGAEVAGIDDSTLTPSTGIVRSLSRIWAKRMAVVLEDGRAPEFSVDHRLLTDDGWVAVQNLKPGQQVLGPQIGVVKRIGLPNLAEVITFAVGGCHTYVSDGLLSHNQKQM